ncbi:alpha/beta hydrolase [Betaproteobacteria bacterium GR16-43]|nr:alpha/beta hydrolase [Betaproteobacteria bacterium GR16-43]
MRHSKSAVKRVNLALQGGGSHGAFAWGMIERLVEDGSIEVEGISGTSAGSVNAVVFAYGYLLGGREGAIEMMGKFWRTLSEARAGFNSPESFKAFKMMTGSISPYQWNPFNWNPFRATIEKIVDFERLRQDKGGIKLFLAATNVETGKARIFQNEEITSDVVMASSCLPFLFQAVEIDGQSYWDGGYMGNPVLYPLFYHTDSRDVIILHINPIYRPGVPRTAPEIENRLNELTFNSALIKEFRAIAFVGKMLEDGWLKPEFAGKVKNVLMHSIRADKALKDLGVASKFSTDWRFLQDLHDRGRKEAEGWLDEHFKKLGRESSVDLRAEFL